MAAVRKPLHLVKLCVGVESLDDYERWVAARHAADPENLPFHVTRMVPKRAAEVIGNSLYWVIKGNIQCRQTVEAIEPFEDADGERRCRLVLGPDIVPVEWKRKRPFQGWRYLKGRPPTDLPEGAVGLPDALRRELLELGLM